MLPGIQIHLSSQNRDISFVKQTTTNWTFKFIVLQHFEFDYTPQYHEIFKFLILFFLLFLFKFPYFSLRYLYCYIFLCVYVCIYIYTQDIYNFLEKKILIKLVRRSIDDSSSIRFSGSSCIAKPR